MWKKIIVLLGIFVLLAGVLSACGKEEESDFGVDGYVYTIRGSEKIAMSFMGNFYLVGDYLYYSLYSEDSNMVKRVPLSKAFLSEEDTQEEAISKAGLLKNKTETIFSSKYSIASFSVDGKGNIYYMEIRSRLTADYQTEITGKALIGVTAEGEKLYNVSFDEMQSINMFEVPIQADQEGNVYALLDGAIFVVNPSGEISAQISTQGYRPEEKSGLVSEKLIRNSQGQVFYVVDDIEYSTQKVWEITNERNYQLSKVEPFPEKRLGRITGGLEGLAILGDDGFLYEYSQSDAGIYKKLHWEDSDLFSSYVQAVFRLNEDWILTAYQDIDESVSMTTFYLMKKTSVDELPQKEKIVLASLQPDYQLIKAVATFNQNSTKYHVMINDYGYVMGMDSAQAKACIARLDSQLVSSNPPDLLDLSAGVDIPKYATKNALEDLRPYIEKSELLNIEDYFENIIEGYTIEGRLICVPRDFQVMTLLAKKDKMGNDMGENMGWTLDDMMELTERYPKMRLFAGNPEYNGPDWVWEWFLDDYCLKRFVDWENKVCHFNNEEFAGVIKWVGEHYGQGGRSDYSQWPEDLLIEWTNLNYVDQFLILETLLGDSYVPLGYPTPDGSLRYDVRTNNLIGMVSASEQKEGAWEFLEYFLSIDPKERSSSCIDSKKAMVENRLKEEMEEIVYYGPNGERNVAPRQIYQNNEGEQLYFYQLHQDQYDKFMTILENADFAPRSSAENGIIDIIVEETQSFYNGDKGVEEVMDIIERRVSILLQEG